MDDRSGSYEDAPLSVQLDLHLDHDPISGRLRAEHTDEEFVGWLGFIAALQRLSDAQTHERS